jgi:hypothetical protein
MNAGAARQNGQIRLQMELPFNRRLKPLALTKGFPVAAIGVPAAAKDGMLDKGRALRCISKLSRIQPGKNLPVLL